MKSSARNDDDDDGFERMIWFRKMCCFQISLFGLSGGFPTMVVCHIRHERRQAYELAKTKRPDRARNRKRKIDMATIRRRTKRNECEWEMENDYLKRLVVAHQNEYTQ
jgi:hypothetical protein